MEAISLDVLLNGYRRPDNEVLAEMDEKHKRNIPNIKRVCCCGRVSSKHEEQESSLYTQRQIFKNYLSSHENLVLVEEVYEQETGTLFSKRPKFQQVVKNIMNNEYDVLLFKDSKRMARNLPEFLNLIEQLKQRNKSCIFISECIDTITADRMTLSMLGMIAESLSNGLHTSVKAAYRVNAEREIGRVPDRCYGYKKPPYKTSTELLFDEERAPIVVEMFTRFTNRESLSVIMKDFARRGIKTEYNKPFNYLSMRRVLRNPIYKGVLLMQKYISDDVRSPRRRAREDEQVIKIREDLRLVSNEMWDEAQRLIDMNRKQNKAYSEGYYEQVEINKIYSSLFRSMITCGECGGTCKKLHGRARNNEIHQHYRCSTNTKGVATGIEECSNNTILKKELFMECITEYMTQIIEQLPNLRNQIKEVYETELKEQKEQNKLNEINIRYKEVKIKYNRELTLYRDGLLNSTDTLKELKKELDYLEKQVKVTDIEPMDSDTYADLFIADFRNRVEEAINSDTIDPVKFNKLFQNITLYKNGTVNVVFRKPDIKTHTLVSNEQAGRTSKCAFLELTYIINYMKVYEKLVNIPMRRNFNHMDESIRGIYYIRKYKEPVRDKLFIAI